MPILPDSSELGPLLVRCVLEALLLCGALVLAYRAGFDRVLTALPVVARRGFVAFVLLWTTVQLVDRWQYFFPTEISFYPLTRFAMYQVGHGQESPRAYRIDAIYSDGSRQELSFPSMFGAIGLPPISTRFRVMRERLEQGDLEQRVWAREQLNLFFESAVRLVEASGDPIPESVEFLSVSRGFNVDGALAPPDDRVLYDWKITGRK